VDPVDVPLERVFGGAAAVAIEHRLVLRRLAIELDAAPQQGVDAVGLRTVRILLGLAGGMVLTMDGDPLAGDHAGGQPQPQAEEVAYGRVQFHGTVRLGTVQEDGDSGDGDVGQQQGCEDQLPYGEIEKTVDQGGVRVVSVNHDRGTCPSAQ
jgi:hypothetical protein